MLTRTIQFFTNNERVLRKVSLRLQPGRFLNVVKPGNDKGDAFLGYICHIRGPAAKGVCFGKGGLSRFSCHRSTLGLTIITRRGFCGFSFSILSIILVKHSPRGGVVRQSGTRSCGVTQSTLHIMKLRRFNREGFSALSNKRRRHIVLTETLARRARYLILSRPAGRLSVGCRLRVVSVIGDLSIAIVTTIRSLGVTTVCYSHLVTVDKKGMTNVNAPERLLATRFVGGLCNISDHMSVRRSANQVGVMCLPHR